MKENKNHELLIDRLLGRARFIRNRKGVKSAKIMEEAAEVIKQLTKGKDTFDNDGWIEWGGGEIPLSGNELVEYRTRIGNTSHAIAFSIRWLHKGWDGDIVSYRVIESDGREG